MDMNEGTQTIPDADEEKAADNIIAFISDTELGGVELQRRPDGDPKPPDGRFCFDLLVEDRKVSIEMPGTDLDKVRFREGLNPFGFYRVYVDGNSWLWNIAVRIARRELSGENEDES